MSEVDYYKVLNITDKAASERVIKKAYHELARKYNPDKNESREAEEKFVMIVRAHSVLSDRKFIHNFR